MPLTPEDVASRKFTVTRLGRSGYDEAEVDEFLDEVEAELTRLYQEREQLQAQLREGGQAVPAGARPDAAPVAKDGAGEPPEVRATGILALAQRTAEEHMADARTQAETILANARALGEQRQRELDEHRREALGSLEQEQTTLQKAVEELRVFERRYRSQLRDYLQGQLSQLETNDGSAQSRSAVATAGPAFATFGGAGGAANSKPAPGPQKP